MSRIAVQREQNPEKLTLPKSLLPNIPDDLKNEFRNSAWCCPDITFGAGELKLAYRLLKTVGGEVNNDNVQTFVHMQTTARTARILAARFNERRPHAQLNADQVEALALIHDLGRFSTHAWYVNDLFLHQIFNDLGVELPLRAGVLWPEDAFKPDQSFTDLQKILMLADMLSKVDFETGQVSTLDQAIQYHEKSRGKIEIKTGHKIEERMIKTFAKSEGRPLVDQWADVYKGLKDLWQELNGAAVQRCAMGNNEYISDRKIALFDLGGVLFKLSDDKIERSIATEFKLDPDLVKQTLGNKAKLAEVQSGRMLESDWCSWIAGELFANHEDKENPQNSARLGELIADVKIQVHQEVVDHVKDLRKRGFIVAALTDTVPSHIPEVRKHFEDVFDRIFCSPEIGVSKKSYKGHRAFWIVLAALGVDNLCSGFAPANVVFHDDREDCCLAAKKIGINTVLWTGLPSDDLIERSRNSLIRHKFDIDCLREFKETALEFPELISAAQKDIERTLGVYDLTTIERNYLRECCEDAIQARILAIQQYKQGYLHKNQLFNLIAEVVVMWADRVLDLPPRLIVDGLINKQDREDLVRWIAIERARRRG